MVVYGIKFPNDKMYIGITTKPVCKRIMQHLHNAFIYNHKTKLAAALRKYVEDNDNVIFSTLQKCNSLPELLEAEKFWIEAYDSFENGYNSTLGGEGTFGYKRTPEQIQNCIKAAKQRSTPEHKKKISEIKKSFYSEEYRRNNPRKGAITFEVFSPDGISLGIWKNMTIAAKDLNLETKGIWKAVRGYRKQYKGYTFKILTIRQ